MQILRCCLSLTVAVAAEAAPKTTSESVQIRSATKARDINGFSLGMGFAAIQKRASLTHLGGDTFEGQHEGIKYVFGFSSLKRVYRIESKQQLGSFAIDRKVVVAFRDKLISKYGAPSLNQQTYLHWELSEKVNQPDGGSMVMATNWMSASISDATYTDPVEIDLKMIDFRILWSDNEKLNQNPARQGENEIQF